MVTLTREQLEARLAALHRASLELVQDIALESLLERIATVACEQANARYAAVGVTGKDGKLTHFIPIGLTEEAIQRMPHPPVGLGLIGALMNTEETIRIPEIKDDPRSSGYPEGHPVMHSFLGVPIRHASRQYGQIYLTDKIGAAEFSEEDQQVIETLAAYAAVAIANAYLYEELRQRDTRLTQRYEDLSLVNDLASTLASSPDIDEILDKALNRTVDYLAFEVGEIFIREEDGQTLRQVRHHGEDIPESIWVRDNFLAGEGLIGQTAKRSQPQIITIQGKHNRYLRKEVTQANYQQVAAFPMTGRRGVLGVLCIATRQIKPLDEADVQLLGAIANWTGTAMENIQLNVQGRRLAILEERERIGMDLHDGIIQSIYAVGLTLEHARLLMNEDTTQARKRIDQSIDDLNSTIRDIRAYILDLRPRQLHEENLINGLQRLVSEFRANTLVEANLQGSAEGLEKLTDTHALTLFHICQEALANIAKHAHARRVDIWLWTTSDRVLLEIRDDGKGFETAKVHQTLGHGMANMQTRARNVGGEVEVTSELNEGTTILAWVPFQNGGHRRV